MKKLFWVIAVCQLVAACAFYKNPSDQARAERLEAKRATQGCAMRDDNQDIRDCVLETAQKKSPKTYTTGELTTGQPVAVVKNTPVKTPPVYEPLNTVDMAYGKSAGSTAAGAGAPDNQVTITTTIEATGPVVVAPPSVSVGDKVSGQPVAVTPATPTKAEEAETYPIVVGKKEAPVVKLTETSNSAAAVQQAQKTQPTTVKQAEPLKEDEPKWWDRYVAGKKPDPVQKEGCPCKDPNDPCPQCYEK